MAKYCNGCVNLKMFKCGASDIHFNARCGVTQNDVAVMSKTDDQYKLKLLETFIHMNELVAQPKWCPLLDGYENKDKEPLKLEFKEEKPKRKFLTYQDRCDMFMECKPSVNWDDIKVGDRYVLPRIGYLAGKVIEVKTISDTYLTGNEVLFDGTLSSSFTYVYKAKAEAHILTKHRSF